MYAFRKFAGAGLIASLLTGVFPLAAQAADRDIEVIHWFTSSSEMLGIKALADSVAAQGANWVDNAIASGDAAISAALNRTMSGDPPGALQLNVGKQLDDAWAEGLLRAVDDEAKAGNWQAALPPDMYNALLRDGHVVAIPINNYAQNRLFYSIPALKKAGFDAPAKTWDEMFVQLDALKAAGVVPIALGGQDWQLRIMFNAVLAGVGGKDLYLKVWRDNDEEALRSDKFLEVARTFGRLRDYVDPASPNREWNLTAMMVANNDAAYQFMGDWAKGEIIAAGKAPGVDFGGTFGPGEQLFIWGGDVFVLPTTKDAELMKTQDIFARGIFDANAQVAANLAWGSIPARVDVDASKFDAIAQVGIEAMKDPARNVGDPNIMATPDVVASVGDLITEYWATPAMTEQDFVDRWLQAVEAASE